MEKDAVLKAFEENGCRWKSGHRPTAHPLRASYPHYIERHSDKTLTWGETSNFGNKVSVDKFRKFIEPQLEISIYSDGKTVKAVGKNGETGIAHCNPEDKFSLEYGAKLAIERMNDIKVGDYVLVEDSGKSYSTYASFFEKNRLSMDWAARYVYGHSPDEGRRYKVIAIYPNIDANDVAVISDCGAYFGRIYLIGVKGLKKD